MTPVVATTRGTGSERAVGLRLPPNLKVVMRDVDRRSVPEGKTHQSDNAMLLSSVSRVMHTHPRQSPMSPRHAELYPYRSRYRTGT